MYLDLSKTNEKSKQLISKIEGEGLNARDLEIVKNQLHKEMNLTWQTPSINKKVIDLTIKPVLEYEYDTFIGYVNVFIVYDDDKLQIDKEFRVAEGSPIYDRINQEIIEIQKEEELKFEKLGVKKFKIRRLIQTIVDKIEKEDSFTKRWNTDDIIEVRGLITGSFRGKYSTFELKIEIEGEGIKKYELYIGKLNITEEELNKAGLQPDIEF